MTAEELRDVLADILADILDVCEGWTRPLSDEQKLAEIKRLATTAWERSSSESSVPAVSTVPLVDQGAP